MIKRSIKLYQPYKSYGPISAYKLIQLKKNQPARICLINVYILYSLRLIENSYHYFYYQTKPISITKPGKKCSKKSFIY